jgi:hypothetical protein
MKRAFLIHILFLALLALAAAATQLQDDVTTDLLSKWDTTSLQTLY